MAAVRYANLPIFRFCRVTQTRRSMPCHPVPCGQPGDQTAINAVGGTFAEMVVTNEDLIVVKPVQLSFEEAAALPTAGVTALQAQVSGRGILTPATHLKPQAHDR
jgi:NADPH:quinone reductase-like Zn-dependent oxidoreductase